MTALAVIGAIAFVWWFRSQWLKTERRVDHDLPLLLDTDRHKWQSEPGSAVDQCTTPGCTATRVRRWTT